MIIKLDEAMKIREKYDQEDVPLIYLSDIFLNMPSGVLQLTPGMRFDETQYDMMIKSNIREFDVVFTERLLAKLIANFPDKHRHPTGRKGVIDMDRMISTLEDANRMSKRKRNVISCVEVYKKDAVGMSIPILKYGEKLPYNRWNQVKVGLNRNMIIDYRIDECGIIVLVVMSPTKPHYMQKFMKNTELISLIVEHKEEFDIEIAPDFNTDTDIYPVDDTAMLLKTYMDNNIKLVIIGDDLNDEYKIALSQLKRYDRYARMLVIRNPDPAKKKEIIMTIKKVYNENIWEKE